MLRKIKNKFLRRVLMIISFPVFLILGILFGLWEGAILNVREVVLGYRGMW